MRHRRSTRVWLGPLALLVSVGVSRVEAAEGAAPSCRNAGVTVSFVRGSMEIDTNGRGALAGVAAWLENDDQRTARLEGYADRTGGATGNQRLSERRAQAAKDYLVKRHGIDAARIKLDTKGDAEAGPDGTRNRRAVVTVTFP